MAMETLPFGSNVAFIKFLIRAIIEATPDTTKRGAWRLYSGAVAPINIFKQELDLDLGAGAGFAVLVYLKSPGLV
jgi:hypothetical protein